MRERHPCTDCSTLSPETETEYTLISQQYGWRLSRTRQADGVVVIVWRCPACWARFKEASKLPGPGR